MKHEAQELMAAAGAMQAQQAPANPDQEFKADAGKAMPDLFEIGFANSIRICQATLEYGAQKYEPHSWRNVPDGLSRYIRAGGRHRQERVRDQLEYGAARSTIFSTDDESGLPHIAHEMFNIMAQFELALAAEAESLGMSRQELMVSLVGKMKEPPTAHKVKGGMVSPNRPSLQESVAA